MEFCDDIKDVFKIMAGFGNMGNEEKNQFGERAEEYFEYALNNTKFKE